MIKENTTEYIKHITSAHRQGGGGGVVQPPPFGSEKTLWFFFFFFGGGLSDREVCEVRGYPYPISGEKKEKKWGLKSVGVPPPPPPLSENFQGWRDITACMQC